MLHSRFRISFCPYCVKPYQFRKGKWFAFLVPPFLGPEIVGKQYPLVPRDLFRAAAHMPMLGNTQSLRFGPTAADQNVRAQSGVYFGSTAFGYLRTPEQVIPPSPSPSCPPFHRVSLLPFLVFYPFTQSWACRALCLLVEVPRSVGGKGR